MSQRQENLLPAVSHALAKKNRKFTAGHQHTSTFREFHTSLSEDLYEFLEDPLHILPFVRWIEGLYSLIPDEQLKHLFVFDLTLEGDHVLARPVFNGKDEEKQTQANLLPPTDVTQSLRETPVHRGINGRSLRDHLLTALEGAKKRKLDFQLDHFHMGGSYLRWNDVEATLPSGDASEQLYDFIHDWLIEWGIDSGMYAPCDTYTLKLRRGRIHLTMEPQHPLEEILDELIAEIELPSEINRDMDEWRIRDALMHEHDEIWDHLETKATELTRERMSLDVDLTDILSTRPVLNETDYLEHSC